MKFKTAKPAVETHKLEFMDRIAQETTFISDLLTNAANSAKKKLGYTEGYLALAKVHVNKELEIIAEASAAHSAKIEEMSETKGAAFALHKGEIRRLQRENEFFEAQRTVCEKQIKEIDERLAEIRSSPKSA